MNYLTRYFSKLNNLFKFTNQKLLKLKGNFLSLVLILFFGFFVGNLFGTVVPTIREYNIGDSFLLFLILFFYELINFLVYPSNKRKRKSYSDLKLSDFLNSFKIGILLGFFIDSFKVGS